MARIDEIQRERISFEGLKRERNQSSFTYTVSFVVELVLLVSLFENPEALYLSPRFLVTLLYPGPAAPFLNAIHTALNDEKLIPVPYDPFNILSMALTLVGHEVKNNASNSSWIMSCYKGQAVYLRVLETQLLPQRAYLTLTWVLGSLSYKGFRSGRRLEATGPCLLKRNIDLPQPVLKPPDLMAQHRLSWTVWEQDGYLMSDAMLLPDELKNSGSPSSIADHLSGLYSWLAVPMTQILVF